MANKKWQLKKCQIKMANEKWPIKMANRKWPIKMANKNGQRTTTTTDKESKGSPI